MGQTELAILELYLLPKFLETQNQLKDIKLEEFFGPTQIHLAKKK
jgi:hypothetical protein